MISAACSGERQTALDGAELYRSSILSIAVHGVIIAMVFFSLKSRHDEKLLRLPQTVTLISLPPLEQPALQVPYEPRRVSAAPKKMSPAAAAAAPSPAAPRAAAHPLPAQTNPVSSATATAPQASPRQDAGSSSGAGNASQGASETGETVRIGSAQTLDNVGFLPLYNPKPDYPPLALAAGIQGAVEVDLLINELGRVDSFAIEKIKGHPSFGEETAKVIGKWRFPPPRVGGRRMKVKYLYTVNFRLD